MIKSIACGSKIWKSDSGNSYAERYNISGFSTLSRRRKIFCSVVSSLFLRFTVAAGRLERAAAVARVGEVIEGISVLKHGRRLPWIQQY